MRITRGGMMSSIRSHCEPSVSLSSVTVFALKTLNTSK